MINLSRFFTKTEYTVAYRFSENGLLKNSKTPFKVLKLNNPNYWYADPFICKYNDDFYVFMEVFQYDKGYAGIGYSKLINGVLSEPKIVIDTGYHMSFPMIVEYEGKLLMIPETCAVNKIQVFECVDFPEKWIFSGCIADGDSFYDSVIFEYNGKHYLFTSTSTDDLYGSTLFLSELRKNGEFQEAVELVNISSDYKISRQAGKMLLQDGILFRVAQDCSNYDYGHALEFLKVTNMSVNNYAEEEYKEIKANDLKTEGHTRGIAGIHTYNRVDNFEVVDFKLCTFSVKSTLLKAKIVLDILKEKIAHK